MTTYTDYDDTVRQSPLKHIGAQDIVGLNGGCTKNGFLRKQGRLERVFKFLTWRQRYVVISHGCLYIFKDEFSRSYTMAVSLKTYNMTVRSDNFSRMPFVFRVLPHDPSAAKFIVFSCPDEANQKSWMAAIKKDLLRANEVEVKDDDYKSEDYVYLEKDVRTHKAEAEAQSEPAVIDPERDYSEIKDVPDVVRHGPLPPIPKSSSSLPPAVKTKPVSPKPKFSTIDTTQHKNRDLNGKTKAVLQVPGQTGGHFKKRMPTPKPQHSEEAESEKPVIDRKSYLFKGSDRSQVEDLLLSKTEGTFLVRESRRDGTEVLSVNIGDILKEYKIYVKEKKCTIDNKTYFDSTEDLLLHYHENFLPNKKVKLTKAYLLQSAGYVNQRFAT